VALFRATTVPGMPPFRVFPSQESRTPLGATCSPVVIHECAETHYEVPCRHRFHRRLRSRRTRLVPRDGYERPFRSSEETLPSCSGPHIAEPSRSTRFTYFEAFILLRVRSHRPKFP
jgi:hypothetical protein